jgi:hypothetical protein
MALDWLGHVAVGAAGGAVTLTGQAVFRLLSKGDERRRRAEVRSEKAAKQILTLLQKARARYEYYTDHEQLPGSDEVKDLVAPMRVAVIDILDVEVRRRVELMSTVLAHMITLAQWGVGFPAEVTRTVWDEGSATLGALRRGERLPPLIEIEKYIATIEEDWQLYRENMERERQRLLEERRSQEEDG